MDEVSYESFPMSNLYDGRKWMSGSWKPLKMDPGVGVGIGMSQIDGVALRFHPLLGPPPFWAITP